MFRRRKEGWIRLKGSGKYLSIAEGSERKWFLKKLLFVKIL